jgi:photosystem II stability/assembly factor-like uncharacterized protein
MKSLFPLFAAMLALAVLGVGARAHAPHDVVKIVKVSPGFATDRTVIAVTLLSDHLILARSTDGGRSWVEYASPVLGHKINRLALSPAYDSDGTIFAATSYHGIWRSTDGGFEWVAVNTGLTTSHTHDVAVSPDYAVDGTVLAATEAGLFRSTDGGETWSKASGIVDTVVTSVTFVPQDPSRVFAGGRTIHGSTNGGLSWTPLASFTFKLSRIAVSPRFSSDNALAVLLLDVDGVLASTDGGVTWLAANTGLSDLEVNDLAFANDGTVFAVTRTDGCFRADAILEPWSLFNEGFEIRSDQTTSHYRSVAPSPQFGKDGQVFVGSFEGFFISKDRGETWKQSDLYNQRLCRKISPSPHYSTDRLFHVGNFGGGPFVWRGGEGGSPGQPSGGVPGSGMKPSRSPAMGKPVAGPSAPWQETADGISSLYTGILVAADRMMFYGYVGLWRSDDSGRSWYPVSIPPKIPRALAISPGFASDQTLFLGTDEEGTFLSKDGGNTWEEIFGGLPVLRAKQIVVSPGFPGDPHVFIASANQGVWRSTDAGATWSKVSGGAMGVNIRAFDISPDFMNDGMLLAGTAGAGLFRSDDRGDTWVAVNNDFASASDNVMESLSFSPGFAVDRTVFVVSLYDGVYRSMDGGWTWQAAGKGLPIDAAREIAVSPAYPEDGTVFLSTHAWLWKSGDGGDTWQRLPGYNRVDDRHPTVYYQGPWRQEDDADSFGQKIMVNRDVDSVQEMEFFGNAVSWHAIRDSESGIAEVRIDGGLVDAVDLYSAAAQRRQAVFSKAFGSEGWHTIRIRVTATKNPASTNVFVKCDGFSFTF